MNTTFDFSGKVALVTGGVSPTAMGQCRMAFDPTLKRAGQHTAGGLVLFVGDRALPVSFIAADPGRADDGAVIFSDLCEKNIAEIGLRGRRVARKLLSLWHLMHRSP